MNALHHVVAGSNARARDLARGCVADVGRAQPLFRFEFDEFNSSDEKAGPHADAVSSYGSVLLVLTHPNDNADPALVEEWRRAIASDKPLTVVLGSPGLVSPPELAGYPLFDISRHDQLSIKALARHLSLLCQCTSENDIPVVQAKAEGLRLSSDNNLENPEIPMCEEAAGNDVLSENGGSYAAWSSTECHAGLKVPRYFTDRTEETKTVIQFLEDECACILAVHGRHGVGKSALVGRALRSMAGAQKGSDEHERVLIHINAESTNSSIFPIIQERLVAQLDDAVWRDIRPISNNGGLTVEAILTELCAHLGTTPYLIVIDKFEHLVEQRSNRIDRQTGDFLAFVASDRPHRFKVILTTRVLPEELKSLSWPFYRSLPLFEGLPSPHGEGLLRDIDNGVRLGLHGAPEALLKRVLSVTHGYPLAIERFVSMLMNDPFMDLESLTEHLERSAESGNIQSDCESLLGLVIGEAFARLSLDEKKVMQAVSAYEEPVPIGAIEFVVEKWTPGLHTADVLRKLLRSHLIVRDQRHFHLHKIDRDYALGLLPTQEIASLRRHAAEYFRQTELPIEACNTESDLQPQFAQFKLYLQSGDRESALLILERVVKFLKKHGSYVRISELARWLSVEPGDERVTCKALHHRADALWCMGEVEEALEIQKDIDKRLDRVGTSEEQLESKGRLIRFNLYRDATESTLQAARDHEKSLTSKCPADNYRRAFAWHNVVACEFELGYLAEALKSQQCAYAVAKDSGDADLIESATLDFALIYSAIGNMTQAQEQIEQALELSKNNQNPRLRALHLGERAWHAASLDHLGDAIDFALEAKRINEKIGDEAGVAYCERGYAEILLAAGKLNDARAVAGRALERAQALRFPDTQYRRVCTEIDLTLAPLDGAIEILRNLDTEDNDDWNVQNLVGTGLLARKQRLGQAGKAFERALRGADLYLSRCSANVEALGARALALAGLACCGDVASVPKAKEAYAAALHDSSGAGTRKRLERRLKILSCVDTSGAGMELWETVFPRPKVYVSYRWTPESQAAVDQLMREAQTDVWLIRDINALRVGDSIDEFAQRIGASRLTIVVLSDGYLRSMNCMTELLYMWRMSMGRRNSLMRRIVPLVVGPLSIADVEGRRVYGVHWAMELKRARVALSSNIDCPPGGSDITVIQKLSELQLYTTDILAWFADTLMARSGEATLEAVIDRLRKLQDNDPPDDDDLRP